MTHNVNRARYARFVDRALATARDRGMTDRDIHEATGIGPSTFHRWRKGEFRTAPDLDKVVRFCAGLGIDPAGAFRALGVQPGKDEPEPEPPLPPEIRHIMRYLSDPNVGEAEKRVVREMLHMLDQLARRNNPPPSVEAG